MKKIAYKFKPEISISLSQSYKPETLEDAVDYCILNDMIVISKGITEDLLGVYICYLIYFRLYNRYGIDGDISEILNYISDKLHNEYNCEVDRSGVIDLKPKSRSKYLDLLKQHFGSVEGCEDWYQCTRSYNYCLNKEAVYMTQYNGRWYTGYKVGDQVLNLEYNTWSRVQDCMYPKDYYEAMHSDLGALLLS